MGNKKIVHSFLNVIFVIFSIFVILAAYNYSTYLKSNEITKTNLSSINDIKLEINSTIIGCINKTIIEGINLYGLNPNSEEKINSLLTKKLDICFNDSFLGSKKLIITKGQVLSNVNIIDDYVIANVSYPINFEYDGQEGKLNEFSSALKKVAVQKIAYDSEGKTM